MPENIFHDVVNSWFGKSMLNEAGYFKNAKDGDFRKLFKIGSTQLSIFYIQIWFSALE